MMAMGSAQWVSFSMSILNIRLLTQAFYLQAWILLTSDKSSQMSSVLYSALFLAVKIIT